MKRFLHTGKEICHAPTAYGALSWNTNASKLMSISSKNQ